MVRQKGGGSDELDYAKRGNNQVGQRQDEDAEERRNFMKAVLLDH